MYAHVKTVTFLGTSAQTIDVQVHCIPGKLNISIVGLPDKSVAESSERLHSAFHAIGIDLPGKKMIINLAPADIHKIGTHYDLAMAIGLLVCINAIDKEAISDYLVLGELGLDGSITPVAGILPTAMSASSQGLGIICPRQNGAEALWAGDHIDIIACSHLFELINHFRGTQLIERPQKSKKAPLFTYPDLSEVKGQDSAKRALEISAAGNHNLLMIGPPGSGKSMLAARLPGILPPLTSQEMLAISIIASITGKLSANHSIMHQRPFRSPHHSCSMAAMVGGGRNATPGEITLAHQGVLFLDELAEYNRDALESLRQTLETGEISIARANRHITYPANFQLIAAMNPCRCGYLGDSKRECNRAPECGIQYQSRISGPLLDRIDIHIEVPATSALELHSTESNEASHIVAARIIKARQLQHARYHSYGFYTNSEASGDILIDKAQITDDGLAFLKEAVEKIHLSMRGYTRVLRIARTIADLANTPHVEQHQLAEALHYRSILTSRYVVKTPT